ncbi:hypothetical protein IFM89_005596 [Coptis chinensis]|uniref:Aminoacyl-tRNA synthetase class II (D/K/N) domain-containing protein n=1 Tax=Coptis chinensis TaxID=261450 RepID=A0A835M1P2_9MAGN|nr:hypothetical protein IFM89_005596 [Coptis chinensis]
MKSDALILHLLRKMRNLETKINLFAEADYTAVLLPLVKSYLPVHVNEIEKENEAEAAKEATFSQCTAKDDLTRLEERFKLKPGLPEKDGKIDCTCDFFARQAFLTVSGQLQVETFACALSNVYTFGPTFRAEHSHSSRHLAEFWMVEPEIAFADLEDDMNCVEEYVKFLCKWLLEHCRDDMEFMVKNFDKTTIDHLEMVSSTPFEKKVKTFEKKVEWGIDLASEHERYLTEVMFKKHVIVYNYPKDFKAFYMRLNDDLRTVAAMDVLVPKVWMLKTILVILLVGFLAWTYQAIQPPPPKICGTPGGPPVTAPRIQLKDGRHLAYKEYGVSKD